MRWFLILGLVQCDNTTMKIYGPTYDGSMDASADVATTKDASDAPADTGGGCPGVTALVAGSATAMLGASRTDLNMFKTEMLQGAMIDRPAMAPVGNLFVGVIHAPGDALQATAFSSSFTDPAAVGSSTMRDAPSLAPIGAVLHLAVQHVDYKYFHGQFTGGMWDSASDPVGMGLMQSYGPRAPAIAAANNEIVLVQAGDNSILYDQRWNGSWQTATSHPSAAIQKTIPPAIVSLSGGAEDLLVVYARDMDYKIMSTSRASGMWSMPMLVDMNAFLSGQTNEPVSLAPLGSGRAIMVYRGTDSKPYFSIYDPKKMPAWTAPAPIAMTNPMVDSLPSVASGVCGSDAVIAYVESGAGVKVASFSAGNWGAPESVAMSGAAKYVAIATRP